MILFFWVFDEKIFRRREFSTKNFGAGQEHDLLNFEDFYRPVIVSTLLR